MMLSRACKYGLQAVLHLARHDGRPLVSKEISQALNIPQHFLAKILQDLSRRGLLLQGTRRRLQAGALGGRDQTAGRGGDDRGCGVRLRVPTGTARVLG